jgi:hypothetical protein
MMQGDEAARALDEIRTRQRQAIDASAIPDWYWLAIGALMILFTAGVESHQPLAAALAAGVFALGIAGSVAAANRHRRAKTSWRYLGRAGALTIVGFVALLVAVSLGLSLGLSAAGIRWSATVGNTVAGITMAIGGPLLTRRLRRLATRHADGVTYGSA